MPNVLPPGLRRLPPLSQETRQGQVARVKFRAAVIAALHACRGVAAQVRQALEHAGKLTKEFNPAQPRDDKGKFAPGDGTATGSSHNVLEQLGYEKDGPHTYEHVSAGTKATLGPDGKGGAVWKPGTYGSTHAFSSHSEIVAAHTQAAAGMKGTAGKPGNAGVAQPAPPPASATESGPYNHQWEAGYFTQTLKDQRQIERVRNAKTLTNGEAEKVFADAKQKLAALDPSEREEIRMAVGSHKQSTMFGQSPSVKESLDLAFAKIGVVTHRDIVVWRGLDLHSDGNAKFNQLLTSAKDATKASIKIKQFENRFVPTTPRLPVAKAFGKSFVLRVTIPAGSRVLPIRDLSSSHHHEHEITLDRGTTFRVAGYSEVGATKIISVLMQNSKIHAEKTKKSADDELDEQDRFEHFSSDFILEVDGEEVYDSDTNTWSGAYAEKLVKADEDDFDWELAAQIAEGLNLDDLEVLVTDAEELGFSVAGDVGRLALGQLGVSSNDKLVNLIDQRAADWAHEHAANLVTGISQATRNMVRDVIYQGLQEGHRANDIAVALGDAYAFGGDRAKLIADTEIARAHSQGALEGFRVARDEEGLTVLKEWLLADDEACDDCMDNEADGPIALEDEFSSGDDVPPAHPNCRCAVTGVVGEGAGMDDGDEEDEQD